MRKRHRRITRRQLSIYQLRLGVVGEAQYSMGGRLQLRDKTNIQSADEFWAAIKTFRRVYTLSGDLTSLIPSSSYASSAQLVDIRLAADYRGHWL